MADKIYVIGHKSPDLDSVASAIAYARFLNAFDPATQYTPAITGEANRETLHALKRFDFPLPEVLANAGGKQVVLVDHNEFSQAVDGIGEAAIVEVLDHHKIDFKYPEPVEFRTVPLGSTCSIIATLYSRRQIVPDAALAGLMLSAVLVDTVITKSPTTTDTDRQIIETLASLAGIQDWKSYGMELFKVRASVSELSEDEIIRSDFKDFNFKAGKFGVGQVETVDLKDFAAREDAIIAALDKIKAGGSYHTVILFITDIIQEGSKFFVSTENAPAVSKAIGKHLEAGRAYIDGVISRKKQVIPMLSEAFD